jgi:hypothetical protein
MTSVCDGETSSGGDEAESNEKRGLRAPSLKRQPDGPTLVLDFFPLGANYDPGFRVCLTFDLG